jgi:14-3-3 protein epsilon
MSGKVDNLIADMGLDFTGANSRDDVMLIARIAEQSDQFDDMIEVLKPYFIANSASDEDVSVEERNLLSVAYKNAVGMRRIAWRAVKKASKTQKFLAYADHSTNYMKDLEEETVELCKDMLNLITKHLIPRAKRAGSYES